METERKPDGLAPPVSSDIRCPNVPAPANLEAFAELITEVINNCPQSLKNYIRLFPEQVTIAIPSYIADLAGISLTNAQRADVMRVRIVGGYEKAIVVHHVRASELDDGGMIYKEPMGSTTDCRPEIWKLFLRLVFAHRFEISNQD